jgi:SpoIID/LytB domain protein
MLITRPKYHRILRCLAVFVATAGLPLAAARAARASELVIAGAGFGHGVGMSQEGAYGYAQRGLDYRAILAHYYRGTTIGAAPAGARVRVLLGRRVKRMSLETYVRGVVSAEVPASWPAAALEAQAVASRTYALTAHAGGSRFDVYADTRSQAYGGAAAYTAATDAAVAATAGQIITYAGRPAIAYFFASSGGRTENVENAWPGSEPEPWLRSVSDPYDGGSLHAWTLSISFQAAAARLGALVHGRFEGIEVLHRGVSPRILSAYVLGSAGRTLVSGDELASRLGLYATWAHFSVRDGSTIVPEPDRSGMPAAAAPEAPSPGEGTGDASGTGGQSSAGGGTGSGSASGSADATRAGAVAAPS